MTGNTCNEAVNGIMNEATKQRLTELTRLGRKTPVSGKRGLAVATSPLCVNVAIDVMKDGGNAVDAFVAASVAQTITEPVHTNINGLFSMLHYEAKSGKVSTLNCFNNAPLHLPVTQQEWDKNSSNYVASGKGVGVPGFWAGVEEALRVFGSLPKKRLLAPAIDLARNGFEVDSYFFGYVFQFLPVACESEQGREVFMPNGHSPVGVGEKIYQKRAADLFERLIEEGNDYFYRGAYAQEFSRQVQEKGGWITPEDFAAYQPRWDTPIQTTYRGYDLYSFLNQDYGCQIIPEIYNMLDLLDIRKMGPASQSGEAAWRMKQIIHLVKQDSVKRYKMNRCLSLDQTLSENLALERLASLPDLGVPKPTLPTGGSASLAVTDTNGNVAIGLHTPYTTFGYPGGNGLFIDGIQIPSTGALYSLGLPKPGERVKLSNPTHLFLKNGKPVLASTSPTVSAIDAVVQVSTNVIDFGMTIEQAVHQPRLGAEMHLPGAFTVEADYPKKSLNFFQHKQLSFKIVPPWFHNIGSFEGIFFDKEGTAHACGDPRKTAQAFAV